MTIRMVLRQQLRRVKRWEGDKIMKSNGYNTFRTVFAHVLLVILSFMCLFFFYILFVNSTRSHADLQKGFSALPGGYFLTNLKNVMNDGSFPMVRGIINSLIVSGSSAAICTYFSFAQRNFLREKDINKQ